MPHSTLQVLFRREEESWTGLARRIRETEGEVIVVLSAADASLLSQEHRAHFLETCAERRHRVRIATRQKQLAAAARKEGIRVFDTTSLLAESLRGHPQEAEAVRLFSPGVWRQKWRSRLQAAGLLSLPRVRVFILIFLSTGLFFFVMFRLLPSAEIRIVPRGELATQTINVLLVHSGSTLPPTHVRTVPLTPMDVRLRHAITYDQISKQFIGTSAEVPMTVVNKTDDIAGLKQGTRLRNQAGMVFRLQTSVTVPAQGTMTVRAKADELDAYGEIIGERGNVPAGLQWEVVALEPEERKTLYAENRTAAAGGKTAYRNVLQQNDLTVARRRLEQELLARAKKDVEERVRAMSLLRGTEMQLLSHEQLIRATFTGFVLPVHLLNQPVTSIAAEGGLEYRMFAYDARQILDLVEEELISHVPDGKRLLAETVDVKHLELRIFDYADDLSWIKGTAELAATEQYVLDPLTPAGARFAKTLRGQVTGLARAEALRIIKNLPEVERVEIRMWPPWSRTLPSLPSHISIVMQ
ncbi:MAG: hypothetical protein PHW10_04985 [Candidatus Peribacteraceae bacterium]|nr:hypothetical protein [Candidatus Peribacteraceae bacterium]